MNRGSTGRLNTSDVAEGTRTIVLAQLAKLVARHPISKRWRRSKPLLVRYFITSAELRQLSLLTVGETTSRGPTDFSCSDYLSPKRTASTTLNRVFRKPSETPALGLRGRSPSASAGL